MTAQEFFGTSYKPTNFRVSFYADSYQYRESKMFTIETASDFEDKKKLITSILKSDRHRAGINCSVETYWATFSEEIVVNGKITYKQDMFKERIRIKE